MVTSHLPLPVLCLHRKQAWLWSPVLQSGSPAWEQGGGQRDGGSPEDAPWPLRVLPAQGAEWRAWCAVSGSWSWCPPFWLWKVRGRGHRRTPTCQERPDAGGHGTDSEKAEKSEDLTGRQEWGGFQRKAPDNSCAPASELNRPGWGPGWGLCFSSWELGRG